MDTARAAALDLSGATSIRSAQAGGGGTPGVARRALALAAPALACAGAGVAALALLAATYTAKRRLDIDVVPGVDMLNDPRIEALIRAALGLLR